MPKLKSHRGAMKRLRVNKKGTIKRSKAGRGHLKAKKSSKQKRRLRKSVTLDKADTKRIKRLIL